MSKTKPKNFFDQVYAKVKRIPRGRVASYGQIARLIGAPGAARTVGWALHGLPDGSTVPWHRVINSQGRISTSCETHTFDEQRARLIEEGVKVDKEGRIDMSQFQWRA